MTSKLFWDCWPGAGDTWVVEIFDAHGIVLWRQAGLPLREIAVAAARCQMSKIRTALARGEELDNVKNE